jgi:hypothetical protein
MAKEPRWHAFRRSNAGTFVAQENKIMTFACFSPERARPAVCRAAFIHRRDAEHILFLR